MPNGWCGLDVHVLCELPLASKKAAETDNCSPQIVFASLGKFALTDADGNNSQTIGYVMIVFACLFIAAFASTVRSPPFQ